MYEYLRIDPVTSNQLYYMAALMSMNETFRRQKTRWSCPCTLVHDPKHPSVKSGDIVGCSAVCFRQAKKLYDRQFPSIHHKRSAITLPPPSSLKIPHFHPLPNS